MKRYQCVECLKIYTEHNRPQDFVCKDIDCQGGGLTGLIIPIEDEDEEPGVSPVPNGGHRTQTDIWRELGLCVLLMDASGSMDEPAFKDHPFQSKYQAGKLMSKREVITDNAAKAIFELYQMLKKDDAYICIIKFDHRQVELFTKSVSQILSEFASAPDLAKYLYDELAGMNGGTDINSALRVAHEKSQKFLAGSLPGLGSYTPLTHTQFSPALNMAIDVPNARVLMYTDGEQLPEYGAVASPFKNMQPDLLMGVYIGLLGEKGCTDLQKIVSKCPVHSADQFFVLDSPQKIATLRGLFRMASGTSGFCPACIGSIALR
jgi:hypothetical protein